MSWGSDVLGITEDTFEMVKAATSGITTGTGIAGITMDDLVSWVPVDVPFFTSTPRRPAKQGALFAMWQILLNVNNQQTDGGIAKDTAAPLVTIEDQYAYSPFAVYGSGGTVSWDAIAQGEKYEDVLAVDTLQTINQQMIGLDIHQLCAQSFALPSAPTPSLAKSTTGGSIAASTAVHVKVAARSGVNYYRGGSQAASSDATITTDSTTATNSVTASCTAVKTACAYDWYVGSSSSNHVYYTTTATNTVSITAIPTAAQTVPTTLAGLFNAGHAGPASVPTADSSFRTYWMNGLLASILGDFSSNPNQIGVSGNVANLVTPGSGVGQGAYYQSLDGAQMTVSGAALNEIDAMNRNIYDTWQVTPTRMLVGSQVINDISNAVLNNPQAVTWLVPTDADGRARIVAGGRVAIYLNKTVNGKPIMLELHPHLPPGKVVSVVDEVPFPGANIATALEVETLYDFFRFDYGADRASGGPRYDFEVRSEGAFKNKASGVMGILDNIGAGIA